MNTQTESRTEANAVRPWPQLIVTGIRCAVGLHHWAEHRQPLRHQPFDNLTIMAVGPRCLDCGRDRTPGDVVKLELEVMRHGPSKLR